MTERIAIVGSRGFLHLEWVWDYVVKDLQLRDAAVVSGGAPGVDQAAEGAAERSGLRALSFKVVRVMGGYTVERWEHRPGIGWAVSESPHVAPDGEGGCTLCGGPPCAPEFPTFRTFREAAFFRNGLIVENCDRLVAFWDGESRGTANSIELAVKAGKPYEVVWG